MTFLPPSFQALLLRALQRTYMFRIRADIAPPCPLFQISWRSRSGMRTLWRLYYISRRRDPLGNFPLVHCAYFEWSLTTSTIPRNGLDSWRLFAKKLIASRPNVRLEWYHRHPTSEEEHGSYPFLDCAPEGVIVEELPNLPNPEPDLRDLVLHRFVRERQRSRQKMVSLGVESLV